MTNSLELYSKFDFKPSMIKFIKNINSTIKMLSVSFPYLNNVKYGQNLNIGYLRSNKCSE